MAENIQLGKLIDGDAERDAIHVAIAPVIAAERLAPGQHIGFISGSSTHVRAGESRLGIVDPFLTDWIEKDQHFYMVLYPNTVTGMRHQWAHPAFDGQPEPQKLTAQQQSEAWIRSYCAGIGCRYDELMERAADHVRTGDYWVEGGRWEGYYLEDEFWTHYEHVTGKLVENNRNNFFSCSC